MVWFRVDDSFYDHPKVRTIPRALRAEAVGTWTLAGGFCARHLTNGVLAISEVEELGGTMAGALALVKAKLWTKTKTEFRFRGWEEWQPTREAVEAARESERTRKARQRAKTKGQTPESDPRPTGSPAPVPPGHPPDNPGTSDGTEPGVPPVSHQVSGHPVPSRPDPTIDSYVSQSSRLPEREAAADDDDGRSRREAYWRGLGISNPRRVLALLVEHVDRPLTEQQAIQVVTQILARSKTPPRDPQRYVEGAITQSWAEIQQQLDEAVIAA